MLLSKNCPNAEFFLVHIFPHLDWIWRLVHSKSLYSVKIRENTDQKNYLYGHFSDSISLVSLHNQVMIYHNNKEIDRIEICMTFIHLNDPLFIVYWIIFNNISSLIIFFSKWKWSWLWSAFYTITTFLHFFLQIICIISFDQVFHFFESSLSPSVRVSVKCIKFLFHELIFAICIPEAYS